MAGVDWSQIFTRPENQAALIKSGLDLAGSAIAGKGNEKQAKWLEAQRQLESARGRSRDLEDIERQNANSLFAGRQAQQDAADETVLGAMGSSPLAFQQDRAKMHALAEVLKGGGPANLSAHMAAFARPGFWTEDKLAPLRPSAEAEQPYWDAVAQASKGRFKGANLGEIYGESGADVDADVAQTTLDSGQAFANDYAEHQAVLDELMAEARATNDQEKLAALKQIEAEEKRQSSGGGFWKKLAKIGIIAGAGIATALTGGAAAPLIGAAAGAGSGAIDGGLKGALLGGALGGVSGGFGMGATAAKQGLSDALKTTFSNPATLIKMGGAGVGGATEGLAQLASQIPGLNRPHAGPGANPLPSRDLRDVQLPIQPGMKPLQSTPYGGTAPQPSFEAIDPRIQKARALQAAMSRPRPKAAPVGMFSAPTWDSKGYR